VTRTRASGAPTGGKTRAVSTPQDPAEVQADKAADVVARGGSVSGWSFGSVPVAAEVHRQDKGSGGGEPEKEAAKKTLEALAKTQVAKDLQDKVMQLPVVRKATEFVGTTPGKIVAGGALAVGVGGLAAGKQPLPFQAPPVPIPGVPGLSAQVKVEGPVNAPTFVGLSLSYQEQGPKAKAGKDDSTIEERAAAFRAQRGALASSLRPQAQKDQDQADDRAVLARLFASQQKLFGQSTLLPILPGAGPKTVDVPQAEPAEQPKPEEPPVQREPASTAEVPLADTRSIDGAVRGGGRQLDPPTRRSMEARFGYDFSSVRVHDDAAASSAADDVSATAFTVGEDIVLGGGYDPATPRGRHLIAHELAHVVQQRGAGQGDGERLHRRSIFESIGILLGLEEGSWADRELRAYLDALTSSGHIDGSYDADNKARAVVRKWRQAAPGWELLGPQKALLIDEMVDGPTLGDDEECILDLLERSDAGDLRVIFADSVQRTLRLEDNLQGAHRIRLNAFVASRFQGGRIELLAGRVTVVEDPVPADAPSYGFSAASFDARLDSDRTHGELIALLDRFGPDDRKKALDHLLQDVWPRAKDEVGKGGIQQLDATNADATNAEATSALEARIDVAKERIRKSERILQHYFLDQVPAAAAELSSGTKAVNPGRRQELRDVLRPRQYTALVEQDKQAAQDDKQPGANKGRSPTFDPKRKEDYRKELTAHLGQVVDSFYESYVTHAGKRGTKDEIEAMAGVAKTETDKVFGQFYDVGKRKPLEFAGRGKSGKLSFWYDAQEQMRRQFGNDTVAKWQLFYYLKNIPSLLAINDEYTANPVFDQSGAAHGLEAEVQSAVVSTLAKNSEVVRKAIATDRNWGGAASEGRIFVDLFHAAEVDEDRRKGWDMFQTLVHEYLHTLVHKDYVDYANSFGSQSVPSSTLHEGVDCILDEVVWARVETKVRNLDLRQVVEGNTNAKLPPIDVPPPRRYASYPEAMRLVGLVGIQNVYAAYFLGLVDRISVSERAAKQAQSTATKAGGVSP